MSTSSSTRPASAEVAPRPTRRTFTREYKLRVIREAGEALGTPGGVGALLRREGLYSSHLAVWRRELGTARAAAPAPKRRGRKARFTQEEKHVQRLERENERLRKRLELAEALVDLQKKVSAILGLRLAEPPNEGSA